MFCRLDFTAEENHIGLIRVCSLREFFLSFRFGLTTSLGGGLEESFELARYVVLELLDVLFEFLVFGNKPYNQKVFVVQAFCLIHLPQISDWLS